MRSIWMIMMAVAACDSGAPTCKDAVTKARKADATMSFDAAAHLVGKCELDGWSVATRQCIAAAKTQRDRDACTDHLASSDRAPMSEAMVTMTRYKDRMCMCTTSDCVQRVSDDMTSWAQELPQKDPSPPMSEAETKAMTAISEQMAKCMQNAIAPPPARP